MDSVQDILAGRVPKEPAEVGLIKQYVQETFQENVQVVLRKQDIIIQTRSSALAGALRLKQTELLDYCQTDKRLVFRTTG
jgi:hypothetical protein